MRMPPASLPNQAKAKPSPGGSGSGGPKKQPRSVAELAKEADVKLVPSQHSVRSWMSSAGTLFDKATEQRLMDDAENAYIYMLRGVSIVLEIIPKHPDFKQSDTAYRELRGRMDSYITILESLKAEIDIKHKRWHDSQTKAEIPSAAIPTSSQSPKQARVPAVATKPSVALTPLIPTPAPVPI
ncbi:hypothetical protein HDV05_007180, partial [Chytridiales sp. JEL 0842]